MKYLRFMDKGIEKNGILDIDVIKEIKGSFTQDCEITGNTFKLAEVKLLAPCNPSKVIAVGLNYLDHVKEFGDRDIPKNPTIFVKLPHTIIGPGDNIEIPEGATRVDYEAELAIVIKKYCSNVKPEEVKDYILGATCLNDVTERNVQKEDGQWIRGKNYPTFCPIGPYIVDGIDYNNLDVKSFLNGELKQNSNTKHFIWKVEELISFISKSIPLNAGDMVTTGTPSGVSPMKGGDVIEVYVEGVGTLKNPVKE